MATVNAYTQINPTKYNPRSLQELMVAPQYMRQQHDQLSAQKAQTEAQLEQLDYLDIHEDIVGPEKQKLEEKLNTTADRLSKEGFNQQLKGDFIGLNQDYQQFLGPKGVGGKAQAIKQQLAERRKELKDEAVKMNYSGKDAENYVNMQLNKYMENYTPDRGLEQINLTGVPEYADIQKDIKDAKSMVGENTMTKLSQGALQPKIIGNKLKFIDKTGKEVVTNNYEGLSNYAQYLEELYLAPDAPKMESMAIRGYSPEKVNNLITKGIKSQMSYSSNRSMNTNYIDGGKAPTNEKIKIGTTTTQTQNLGDITDISTLDERINGLSESDDPSDKLQSRELSSIKETLLSGWKNSSDYELATKDLDQDALEVINNKLGIVPDYIVNNEMSRIYANNRFKEYYEFEDVEGPDGQVLKQLYRKDDAWKPGQDSSKYKSKVGEPLTQQEYETINNSESDIENLGKKQSEYLNKNITNHGYKRVQFNFSGLDNEDRKQLNGKIQETIGGGDNVTVMQLQDEKGKSINVDNVGAEFFSAIKSADKLKSGQLIKQQGKMGYQVTFEINDSYGYDSEIKNAEEVTAFVALNSMYDNDTGQLASEILPVLDYLPEDMQYEVSKNTSMGSLQQPTRDISKIGSTVKTPLNRFLKGPIGEYSDERLLDFYIPEDAVDKNNPSKYKYVTPMSINENDVNNSEANAMPLIWGDVIPAETFDQDERFEQLINTKTSNMMIRHIQQFLNVDDPDDPEAKKIRKLVEGDLDDKVEALKILLDRPIKLKSNEDMFELTNFNNLQY